ncbi:biotin--[acetyl-CoA-carboxylase] ligase [Candidatus Nitrosacidococcus tergens]|uniref:Biotin/acetyl-CoA-carboxylase ligase n=1 Tax=Candidatus Nitrosacidococcus tergens TaxID=553981 RepID=A0A7G1Q9E6_9GAMM|nr:biotin--[acetyl-CoA-carboxylase] ligase [Candidatus Nitrosacidococcus tergens]CAB1275669.1 Biotin/acetyl-CoA-carboxylase ligase [Candidatus Nitrosacidococcus tergens]
MLPILNAKNIKNAIGKDGLHLLSELWIYPELDSTNDYLLAQAKKGASRGSVCLAEKQSAGKGQHNRTWISPPTGNIYLSLLWYFHNTAKLSGLSLAIGVGILRAFEKEGITFLRLKWPNDIILLDFRKLGGILVELVSQGDVIIAVIGVGININMSASYQKEINQPYGSLSEMMGDQPIFRDYLAGRLIYHLLLTLARFEKEGLSAFLEDWQKWDLYYNEKVYLYASGRVIYGTACGIDDLGNLLFEEKNQRSCYSSGKISLRLAQ